MLILLNLKTFTSFPSVKCIVARTYSIYTPILNIMLFINIEMVRLMLENRLFESNKTLGVVMPVSLFKYVYMY